MNAAPAPVWIRLPGNGQSCPHCGLKRTTLLNLVRRSGGKIRAAHLKEPGKLRGSWVINFESLNDYLSEAAERTAAARELSSEEIAELPTE